MTKQSSVSAQEIQSVVTSPTARTLMLALSRRERDRAVTDLRRFRNSLVKDGTRIDHMEYYRFFKDLESKGAGQLKMGKRGNPARFVWATSMKQVGAYGSGVTPVAKPIPTKEKVVHKTVAFFQVRGTSLRLDLPGDVTEAQISELAAVLGKL